MKIEWKDNSANVGRLELRVRPSMYADKWNTIVCLGLAQIGSHHELESDAAARAWCEEWVDSLVGPALATARAEAALAEREACVSVLDAEIAALEALGDERDYRGTTVVGWRIKSVRAARDAIHARTTPATLSTDTLAAIAEARGLRVVEPEHLAELEALRAAVDEETAIDRERAEHGCGDASCVVERATGMTTNGGCRCGRRALRAALQRARKELAERGGKDGAK